MKFIHQKCSPERDRNWEVKEGQQGTGRENAEDSEKLKERERQSCNRTAWSPLSTTRRLQETWIQSLPSTSLRQKDKKKEIKR